MQQEETIKKRCKCNQKYIYVQVHIVDNKINRFSTF